MTTICRSFYVWHRKELGKARKKALEAEDKKEAEIKKVEALNSLSVPEIIEKVDLSDIQPDVCNWKTKLWIPVIEIYSKENVCMFKMSSRLYLSNII